MTKNPKTSGTEPTKSRSLAHSKHGDDGNVYPPPCTNREGHSWVISEETDRCYCEYCHADGDA